MRKVISTIDLPLTEAANMTAYGDKWHELVVGISMLC